MKSGLPDNGKTEAFKGAVKKANSKNRLFLYSNPPSQDPEPYSFDPSPALFGPTHLGQPTFMAPTLIMTKVVFYLLTNLLFLPVIFYQYSHQNHFQAILLGHGNDRNNAEIYGLNLSQFQRFPVYVASFPSSQKGQKFSTSNL